MKKIHFLMCFLTLAATFSGCNPSDSSSSSQNDTTFAHNFGIAVSKDFIGQVVDTDNHPIQNVEIKIGTSTVQTDINGVFIINGASVHEKFAYITAAKVGYVDGSRAMVPTSGKNNVKIMLIANTPLQTVQSGVASEVALPNGTKVNFDGAFQDGSGNAYTGTVSVSMFHLLPSNENIDKLMPGMLYAQTSDNKEAVLETFGMLNVELRGSAGQKLNIKEGHTAQITLKIDDSQIATAPSSVPLWHFDTEKGYWKEDGVATKVGNNYVGEASHFSWWNCDMPNSSILLTFNIVDGNGNPLSGIGVNILNSAGYHASGMTDSNGQLSGVLSANQILTVNVYSPFYLCGANNNNNVYTTTVGPFTSDTVVPNIIINSSATISNTNVLGALVKCDNTPVTNGYVSLSKNGNSVISTVTNGAFSFNEIFCPGDTNFTLQGFDFDNVQQTNSISYNFMAPLTHIANIQACTAVNEFISYQIDANPTVFLVQNVVAAITSQSGIPNTGLLYISGEGEVGVLYISSVTHIQGEGIYTTATFSIEGSNVGYISNNSTNTVQFNLSHIGAVGEYIDMAFSGTYPDQQIPGVTHTITGVVHAKRS